MNDGKVFVRINFDNRVIIIDWEDNMLLKLKGGSTHAKNIMEFKEQGMISSSQFRTCKTWIFET